MTVSLTPSVKGSDKDSTTVGTFTSCFDHLSQRIHTQINTFLVKDAQSPLDHDELDFDDLIQQLDPQLWNAACLLTRSTSELRGTSRPRPSVDPSLAMEGMLEEPPPSRLQTPVR